MVLIPKDLMCSASISAHSWTPSSRVLMLGCLKKDHEFVNVSPEILPYRLTDCVVKPILIACGHEESPSLKTRLHIASALLGLHLGIEKIAIHRPED